MRILIVDDVNEDRDMLKDLITQSKPDYKIAGVDGLSHMYAELERGCDLLFLDISLNGDKEPDDQGLNALYDIIDSYPDLPICMVTGYYYDNLNRFLDEFLTKTTQIVNFLDKGSYDDGDLSKVFSTAQEYHLNIQKRIEDRQAADYLLEEVAENEKKRIQEDFSLELEDMEKRLNILEVMKKAFEGRDWSSRIPAEIKLTDGKCNTNAALLSIELDRISKLLCGNKLSEFHTFYQRAAYLAKKYSLAKTTNKLLNDVWRIRNKIIHARITACKGDAYQLLECVQLLERLEKRGF